MFTDGDPDIDGHLRLGINVVPSTNPDVVPRTVSRAIEEVDPSCQAVCAPDPTAGDDEIKTSGLCR